MDCVLWFYVVEEKVLKDIIIVLKVVVLSFK